MSGGYSAVLILYIIDREFEFYDFFSVEKIGKKIVILQIIDVSLVLMYLRTQRLCIFGLYGAIQMLLLLLLLLLCSGMFIYNAFIHTTDHCKVQTAFVSLFYIFINMKP